MALGLVLRLIGRHRLAQLVGQHEGRLVGDVEVAAELQSADALGGIGEDRDRHQVVADRQLAAVEGRAAGDAELPQAALAFEQAAGAELVSGTAAAMRAHRIAARLMPPQRPEGAVRLLVRHAGNLRQREGAGLGGEEEVGGHCRRFSY